MLLAQRGGIKLLVANRREAEWPIIGEGRTGQQSRGATLDSRARQRGFESAFRYLLTVQPREILSFSVSLSLCFPSVTWG